MREYRIKVTSYTGFHLKCIHFANSYQVKFKVKLAITSNTALDLSWESTCVDSKNFAALPGDENKMCKNSKCENFPVYGMYTCMYVCMYVHVYIHTYIHAYMYSQSLFVAVSLSPFSHLTLFLLTLYVPFLSRFS